MKKKISDETSEHKQSRILAKRPLLLLFQKIAFVLSNSFNNNNSNNNTTAFTMREKSTKNCHLVFMVIPTWLNVICFVLRNVFYFEIYVIIHSANKYCKYSQLLNFIIIIIFPLLEKSFKKTG